MTGPRSELTQQVVIFCMRPDPEPENVRPLPDPDGAMMHPHAGRENRPGWMDLPEAESWMMRIVLEQRISMPGLLADLLR